MEQVAKEYSGKVKVLSMDIDQNPETPSRFGVMAIPTLLFFKDGKEALRVVGAVPKSRIEDGLRQITG